ncbi:MAG: right-handed parallel beta-helix repeat-containing protein [Solirubrobacterales bacterium]
MAGVRPAQAVHDPPGDCSPGYGNVRGVDLETFFDGKSNVTICLRGNLTDFGDFNVRWSNMNHVTVRSAPGTWHYIRSRIWIDNASDNVSLYGLTLDAGDFAAEPGATGLAINADNVRLEHNMITNRYGLAGSCVTNDAEFGVATNLQIRANRIFDCGRDETHDHGIYTNAMDRPIVRANWIYENAGRGINLGPATEGANIYRNVIADNCANPLGGPNDCSGNVMFWGSTSGTEMNNNTIAFPRTRWNVAGCDEATGTDDCRVWTGTSNSIGASCYITTNDDYSGDPPGSGISPGFPGKYATVSTTTSTVADPWFADRLWAAHAHRNYRVRNSACSGNQPQQTVGPPTP